MSDTKAYYRPSTRGELRDKLKEGVACEIVSSNVYTTYNLMKSLDALNDDGFSIDSCGIRPSENTGWSVFDAKNNRRNAQ